MPGSWQVIGAANSFAWLVATWAGYLHRPAGQKEYYRLRFLPELFIGLYLLLKTEHLFGLFTPAVHEEKAADVAGGG